MLVRNLTKQTLKLRAKGTRIILKPYEVTSIDDCLISKEQVKAIYGRYVLILTDKDDTNAKAIVQPKAKEDLENTEANNDVQTPDEGATEENGEGEVVGDETNAGNNGSEDVNNDVIDNDGELDGLVEDVLKELEDEGTQIIEETKPKNIKKNSKKSGKKN